MKIALVSDWFLPRTGGIERHITELAGALVGSGHEVEIVTATPGDVTVDELPGVPIIRLDMPLLPGWKTVFRPSDGESLIGLFHERGYDLVHAHSIYSPLALAATHAGRALRLPTVLTAHSLVRYVATAVFRLLDFRLMWSSWPSVITAVSEAVAADLRRASYASEVQVLPNGLNLPSARARAARSPNVPVNIVLVSRMMPRKRPEALVRAFAALQHKTRRPTRLTLVGGGQLVGELTALAQELGIAELVDLRGWCTRAEVMHALAAADIFALPTQKEAFGLAALEGAAMSLPVVTMRGSGAAELFTPDIDGVIAADDRDLATQLARLVDDDALRARLGRGARVLAERFSWSLVIERTLALYRLAMERVADRTGRALAQQEAHV